MYKGDRTRWLSEMRHPELVAQYRFVRAKRRCEYWAEKSKIVYLCVRFIYEHYKVKYNTDIPARCKIGGGFKIRHLGGIVFNPGVEVGKNVDCLNGVLLGQIDSGAKAGTPIIGNDVFLGTNSIVVGKVKVGNDVLIAPGAYVNFDVPDHSIVIGNPGKIIPKENATEGYIASPVVE
ncbi:serine acetyltransferase [Faecalibacterium prausnitzii]|uniref:Serine acetyltransferase n=1 Tax=Faecalibacterium prausnitzii TaxID=853 RepID=A0A329U8P4_9FIRM|nr:serine acetyltransferase [Faecalibacterium prausnitzii]RAW57268.1 serine acetyltransferase [Faecalibacterium prausnitzii]